MPGARRRDKPGFVEPCDPTLHDIAPSGDEWIHEIKSDGYRAQAHLSKGKVVVYSRNGYDWTEQFSGIAASLRELKREAILDGEAVVLGSNGVPDYEALRRALSRRSSTQLVYHVFDLLYLDGFDLRTVTLIERKRLLRELLRDAPTPVAFVDHLEALERRFSTTPAASASKASSPSERIRFITLAGWTPGASANAPRAMITPSLPLSKS